MPLCTRGASVRLTDRCCRISTSSKSLTVVPSSMLPCRWMVPVAVSSASTRLVLPDPEWPTSTTFRTWSAAGALPAAPPAPLPVVANYLRLLAICWCARPALTPEHRDTNPHAKNLPGDREVKPTSLQAQRKTAAADAVLSDGHAESATARHDARFHSGRRGPGAYSGHGERDHDRRHGGRGGWGARPVPDRRAVPWRLDLYDLRAPGHAGRRAGPNQGHQRDLGSVPRLDHGPDRRRRHLQRPGDLVLPWRSRSAARRGVAVLPGRGHIGVLYQGPGRGPRAALRRGPDRTARAHAHLADRGRRFRPRRAVHSERGALGARGGKRLYLRAAGTRGVPGRPESGSPRRTGGKGG